MKENYRAVLSKKKEKHDLKLTYKLLAMNDCVCFECKQNIIDYISVVDDFTPPIVGRWDVPNGYVAHALFCSYGCLRQLKKRREEKLQNE